MASSTPTSAWWQPERHADRRPALLARGAIKSAIRAWFEAQGFVEVDTGCLQVSPGNETHLHAFSTELVRPDLSTQELHLHTSPEIACKKLLAAGEQKIFTFAQVFRNRERGALHHPEFTMLEWYRADQSMHSVMADCEEIVRIAAETADRSEWSWREMTTDVGKPPVVLSCNDVFQKHLGIDLSESLANGVPDRDKLASSAQQKGVSIANDDTWSDIFSRCLVAIEPMIWTTPPVQNQIDGKQVPVFLNRYPVNEAPLAQPDPDDPCFAERFELFISGVELANGYGELNNGSLLRERLKSEMDEKQRIYGERYPIDEDFIEACSAMPPAAGCALGFDRLVMLALGAERIDQIIWTPLGDAAQGPGAETTS